jgi:uncharacterized protein YciI
MQFIVLAYDGTDSDAPERRLAARQAHLDAARSMKAAGHFLEGGALLNDDGQMVGSMLVMEFRTREELDQWLAGDPYVTGDVWKNISVLPYRRAPV